MRPRTDRHTDRRTDARDHNKGKGIKGRVLI